LFFFFFNPNLPPFFFKSVKGYSYTRRGANTPVWVVYIHDDENIHIKIRHNGDITMKINRANSPKHKHYIFRRTLVPAAKHHVCGHLPSLITVIKKIHAALAFTTVGLTPFLNVGKGVLNMQHAYTHRFEKS